MSPSAPQSYSLKQYVNVMDRFGLIGYPISHSQSPELFKEAFGGRYGYDLIETPDFEEAWKKFVEGPYKAVNVTAPFKSLAAEKADIRTSAVRMTGAANILVKTPEGIKAYNSDYMAVKSILESCAGNFLTPRACTKVAVIGGGGAGRAALAAAEDSGFSARLLHHDEIAGGIRADIIIYTLPKAVEGIDRLDSSVLIEANYRDPVLASHRGYIPGTVWLRAQADLGYDLMVKEP